MQDENRDAGSRVRHVPIRVEQRTTPRSNQRQRDDQVNYQNGAYKNHQRNGDTHPEFYSSGQASPETSTINISHKPPPPARNTAYHNMSANNIYCNNSDELNAENERRYNNVTPVQGQDKERERSRNKHGSTTSPAPNSDKLVSSPEPIPLPPPEQHSGAHNDSNETTDQKKAKNDNSVSDKINLIKVELSQYLQAIVNFNGTSSQSKDYRYLDEMLTRCVINLDNIMVGESLDLRQQRKAVINLVDKATSILQKKVEINKDIHDLSEYMSIS